MKAGLLRLLALPQQPSPPPGQRSCQLCLRTAITSAKSMAIVSAGNLANKSGFSLKVVNATVHAAQSSRSLSDLVEEKHCAFLPLVFLFISFFFSFFSLLAVEWQPLIKS